MQSDQNFRTGTEFADGYFDTPTCFINECPSNFLICNKQFNDKGCENCEFIDLEGNKGRIEEVLNKKITCCSTSCCTN